MITSKVVRIVTAKGKQKVFFSCGHTDVLPTSVQFSIGQEVRCLLCESPLLAGVVDAVTDVAEENADFPLDAHLLDDD